MSDPLPLKIPNPPKKMFQLTLAYSIPFPWFKLHSLTPFHFEYTIPCLILLTRAALVTEDMVENVLDKPPSLLPIRQIF